MLGRKVKILVRVIPEGHSPALPKMGTNSYVGLRLLALAAVVKSSLAFIPTFHDIMSGLRGQLLISSEVV